MLNYYIITFNIVLLRHTHTKSLSALRLSHLHSLASTTDEISSLCDFTRHTAVKWSYVTAASAAFRVPQQLRISHVHTRTQDSVKLRSINIKDKMRRLLLRSWLQCHRGKQDCRLVLELVVEPDPGSDQIWVVSFRYVNMHRGKKWW